MALQRNEHKLISWLKTVWHRRNVGLQIVCPIFSRRLKLLACRPRFSEGSPANTLEALPCVLLPPCYCKLPCHWILLTISHPNHHRSWKTSHFEVKTREVVWAPPTASSVKTFASLKIGMDLQILEARSFSWFIVWLLRLDFSVNPQRTVQC